MVRVEKVFKEKEYHEKIGQSPNLSNLEQDLNIIKTSFTKFPIRNTLAVFGLFTILYIGFKVSKKFAIITKNL